jgi:peptidoglycan/LPS O-acetylase OafA/YrhL
MASAAWGQDRLGFLDVARGLAALLVLIEHGLEYSEPGYVQWGYDHVYLGKVGVLVFLIVSGFIIPVSLQQGGSNARFWLRRFFRLFPAYWLSILLAYGCCCVDRGPTSLSTGDWLLNLTMLHGFFNRPHVWGVFWTLQLELVIYATCSLLFAVRLLNRPGWVAGLVLAGYAGSTFAGALLAGKPVGLGGTRFLYLAPLVGMVAQRRCIGGPGRGKLVALVLAQAALLPAAWIFNHSLFGGGRSEAWLRQTAVTWGVGYTIFFLLLAARNWRMPAAACWLGRISYSVYLFHLLIIVFLPPEWPVWAYVASLLGGTLVLADLTYRFVEAPGIAVGRALVRRWLPVPNPAVPVLLRTRQAA